MPRESRLTPRQEEHEQPQGVRRVLIADELPERAFDPLIAAGYEVDYRPTITPDELLTRIAKYQM